MDPYSSHCPGARAFINALSHRGKLSGNWAQRGAACNLWVLQGVYGWRVHPGTPGSCLTGDTLCVLGEGAPNLGSS